MRTESWGDRWSAVPPVSVFLEIAYREARPHGFAFRIHGGFLSPMTARLRALMVLFLLCACAWTFRDVVGFESLPLADDDTNIFFNPHLSGPGVAALRWMFTNLDYVHRYMPVGWLGFSVVYSFSGLDPFGYHAANVVLHALNAWLVFLVVVRLVRRFQPEVPETDRLLAAGAAALLWAVHPLRSETVAWCSGMLYSQALFLALLAVHARLSELEARSRGSAAWPWIAAGTLAYAASVLTYPVALFLPLALLIVDLAWRGALRLGSLLIAPLAWCAVSALSILLNIEARYTVSSYLLPSNLADFGVVARALQAFYACALFIGKTFWPVSVLRMSGGTIFELDPRALSWWLCAALIVGLSLAFWALRRRAPFVGLGWAAFLVLMFPNLGFMEHPYTVADRYMYLPGCAFSVVLAFALLRIRPAARPLAWALCLACGAFLAALAAGQCQVWRSSDAYFSAVLAHNELDDIRQITVSRLALLRFFGGDVRGGRLSAVEELGRRPDLGGVVLTWRQMAPRAALSAEVAGRRLQEWPAAPWAVLQLEVARSQAKEGRAGDALDHIDSALGLAPEYMDARFYRAVMLADLGRLEAAHDWLIFHGWARGRDRGRDDFLTARIRALYEARGVRLPPALRGPAS